MPSFAQTASSPVAEAAASATKQSPASLDWDLDAPALFDDISQASPFEVPQTFDDVELALDDVLNEPIPAPDAARPVFVEAAEPPTDAAEPGGPVGAGRTLTRAVAAVGVVAIVGAVAWPHSVARPDATAPIASLGPHAIEQLERVVAAAGERSTVLSDRAARARAATLARRAAGVRKRQVAARARRAATAARAARHGVPVPVPSVSRVPEQAPVVPRPQRHGATGGSGTQQIEREFGL